MEKLVQGMFVLILISNEKIMLTLFYCLKTEIVSHLLKKSQKCYMFVKKEILKFLYSLKNRGLWLTLYKISIFLCYNNNRNFNRLYKKNLTFFLNARI